MGFGKGFGYYLGRARQTIDAELRRLRMIRHVPSEWLTAHFVSLEDPIIIGGCGRSGTTLMSVIMNGNSNVYCGPEDSLLLEWDFTIDQIAEHYGYELDGLCKKAKEFANHGEFVDFVMRDQKERRNVARFAAKQPRYGLCIPSLFQRFPSARFVYLCRDGRDVALSFRKNERYMGVWPSVEHDETGKLSMRYCAKVWRMFVNAYLPFERDPRCKHVCYERLCTHPREVVEDLCEFLGLPFEESMLAFREGTEGRDDLERPHLVRAKSAIDTAQLGRWKDEFSAAQIQEFEKHAGRELLHCGYELSTGINAAERPECSLRK